MKPKKKKKNPTWNVLVAMRVMPYLFIRSFLK